MKRSARIFIGLRELSGYYHHLKKGFDALGIEAVFANLSGHPYRYGEDKNPRRCVFSGWVSYRIS